MGGEVIIVAVDASKEITDYALQWAVCKVTSMDSLMLLAVLPGQWSANPRKVAAAATTNQTKNNLLSRLLKKCRVGHGHNEEKNSGDVGSFIGVDHQQNMSQRIKTVCEHMMRRLCVAHNKQVVSEVKTIADAQLGSVASEARKLDASWVVLDRWLKKEADCCLKQLNCNIVVMDHATPKILRAVNPILREKTPVSDDSVDPTAADVSGMKHSTCSNNHSETSRSSLGFQSPKTDTAPSSSLSTAEKHQLHKTSSLTNKPKPHAPVFHLNSDYFHDAVEPLAAFSPSSSVDEFQLLNFPSKFNKGDPPRKSYACPLQNEFVIQNEFPARRSTNSPRLLQYPEGLYWLKQFGPTKHSSTNDGKEKLESPLSPAVERTSSLRRAMSISIKHPPPIPPPLCSICKLKSPLIGKSPRKFCYKEIEIATNKFSKDNVLAEGGYGTVYKGILPNGQVVAVKQHMQLSAQGASEFCSEVEVLSCAQHRNLVMLVGYCTEREWLLVYEFACNGSLDKQLYGAEATEVMAWHNRMKVAIGSARGLRYLHEDCRVGCIVHRDFRPNNILLTHDFEPMVGDFGLARWQADGQSAEETRVIGAFGYLAPEYTQTGLFTEKADVYSFGVVLLELLSGIKATDFSRNTGQQFVLDWGLPLLERKMIDVIIDPRLEQNYEKNEVECMMFAARLCTSPDPQRRPRMSKVLRILEGDIPSDMALNHVQHTLSYPKQYVNNIFGTETPLIPRRNQSSSTTCVERRNRSQNNKIQTWRPSEELSVSGEYQAYLQGSLAKFLRNLNASEQNS